MRAMDRGQCDRARPSPTGKMPACLARLRGKGRP